MIYVDPMKVLAASFLSTAPTSILCGSKTSPRNQSNGSALPVKLKVISQTCTECFTLKAGCEKRDATSAKRLLRRGQETGNCNVFESASAFVGLNDTH